MPSNCGLVSDWKMLIISKILYWAFVEGVAANRLCDRLGLLVDDLHSFWFWASAFDYLSKPKFSLSWRLAPNALPLLDVCFKVVLSDMPDCHRCDPVLEETAFFHSPLGTCQWVDSSYRFRTACVHWTRVLVRPCVDPWPVVKRLAFIRQLSVTRMVVWVRRAEGILRNGH